MSDFYPVLIGIAREERVEEGVRVGVGRVGGGVGWGGRGGRGRQVWGAVRRTQGFVQLSL